MTDSRILSKKEAKAQGLKVDKGQVWRINADGKVTKLLGAKLGALDTWQKLTKQQSKKLGMDVDEGQVWMKNSTTGAIKKIGEALGKGVEKKGVPHKAKGGIVQKFSKGGTVERPRGVGIAKRGFGRVIR